jgi:adenine-specific DNA-methyltransferase
MTATPFAQFQTFLREMFQYDHNDLDFGIFRVLRFKRTYIEQFINGDGGEDLRGIVARELAVIRSAESRNEQEALGRYLEELGKKAKDAWTVLQQDPNDADKQAKLRQAIEALEDEGNLTATLERLDRWLSTQRLSESFLEAQLYNYLLNFFELYYQNGDFGYNSRASQAFKVPYEADYDGSDTLFHWKHKDSYYIKTANSFPEVRVEVRSQKIVFRLEAGGDEGAETTAQNNNKDTGIKHYRLASIVETDGEWRVTFRLAETSTPKTDIYPALWRAVFSSDADLTPFLYRKEKDGEAPKPIFKDLGADYDKTEGGQVKGINQLRLSEDAYAEAVAERPEFADHGRNKEARVTAAKAHPTVEALYALDKALNRFYVGQDADYFVHKDLRGFLTREKNRFIKNVVFSDLEALLDPKADGATRILARAFNAVASRIIEFLDALETFQRNLYTLKKKVVDTHWLISVGKIPKTYYPRLLEFQTLLDYFRDEFKLDVKSVDDLKNHPTLVVDTSLFVGGDGRALVDDILSDPAFDNLDEQTDGLLIHSENWQALNLLQEKYRERVKCIYIDPPYNTGGDEFLYKDSFRHSSWATMMENRLDLARNLLRADGTLTTAIGREEIANLFAAADSVFDEENRIGELIWEKGRKNDAKYFSLGHDYMIVHARSKARLEAAGAVWREEKPGAREILAEWRRLMHQHGDDYAAITAGIRAFYAALPAGHPALKHRRYNRVDKNGIWRDHDISWPGGNGPRYEVPHSVTKLPCKIPDLGWRFATYEKFKLYDDHGFIEFREDHSEPPILKRYLNYVSTDFDPDTRRKNAVTEEGEDANVQVMPSVFYKGQQPTVVALRNLMGADVFKNPKDPDVIGRILDYMGGSQSINLDFFGGSGTTAHAVIALNRADGEHRKFILVEMGNHFHQVLKPRIARVMHASKWQEGEPANRDGWQGIVKIQRLEQYEDILANLETAWDGERLPEGVPVQYLFRPEQNRVQLSLDLSRPFDNEIFIGKDRSQPVKLDLMETWVYLQGYWARSRRVYQEGGRRYLAIETQCGTLVVFRDIREPEDDSAALNAIAKGYRDASGAFRVQRMEVNHWADLRRLALPTTLLAVNDFDRGAVWN